MKMQTPFHSAECHSGSWLSCLILLHSSFSYSASPTVNSFSRSSLNCHLSQWGLAGLPCLKLGWGDMYTCTHTRLFSFPLAHFHFLKDYVFFLWGTVQKKSSILHITWLDSLRTLVCVSCFLFVSLHGNISSSEQGFGFVCSLLYLECLG